MGKIIAYDKLADADLVVDATYKGGSYKNVKDDPISLLIGVGNQGGFRYLGSPKDLQIRNCVLYSDLVDPDWPDDLDVQTGIFTYYGDNRKPGHELHDTPKSGNVILRDMFDRLHTGRREQIPPVFVFTKGWQGRDVVFRGLAVPGAASVGQKDDLVAIWRSTSGQRFQNYRAVFSILDVGLIPRHWINTINKGSDIVANAPPNWLKWRKTGVYYSLQAPRTKEHRTPAEQIPSDADGQALLRCLVDFYKQHENREYAFEKCAAEIFRLMEGNVMSIDLTRPWRDGGRDALGRYRIGNHSGAITVDFALEAKCKNPSPTNSSGVKETSRLISRIRHRQFGVFITTSCVAEQAYKEIIEDGHPVTVIAGVDIVAILREHGIDTEVALTAWLNGLEQKM